MSTFDEPPAKLNERPSTSLFFSLPDDIILDILARVPKRYYPILSCVSKKFQVLVRSPEIHKFRSILGKDSLYFCFHEIMKKYPRKWFTLSRIEKNPTENLFASIDFPFIPQNDYYSSIITVGPEIFIIGGGAYGISSSSLWIFDFRSGKYRQGPSMHVELMYSSAGLVGSKIYVIGWDIQWKIHAEFFDLKTQTWKPALIPKGNRPYIFMSRHAVALDRKLCWLKSHHIAFYDTRDGSYEVAKLQAFANNETFLCNGACVIDNVLYVYFSCFGLMWYDSKLMQWKMVNGLDHLNKIAPVGMAEYYGKLAYMWTKTDNVVGSETKEIWCRMIALDKSEVGIHGTAEPSQLLGIVPRSYSLYTCRSLSF